MATTQTFDPVAYKEAQRAEWQSCAAGWDRWYPVLEGQEGGARQTRKLLELARIGPGDTVLDVATGYGEPALTAARTVQPGGRVVASDLAGDMLTFARRRAAAAGLDNVEFVESDAEALEFEEETFDAVLCRHGLQFLVDVAGTLRRFRTFLKPGGRLAAVVWGPPQAVGFARALPVILAELELPPPPAGRPGIFALSDAGTLAATTAAAGFREVETGPLDVVYEAPSPEDWTQLVRDISAPITKLVTDRPPDAQERVWRAVTEAWAPFVTAEGGVRVPCQAVWLAATR